MCQYCKKINDMHRLKEMMHHGGGEHELIEAHYAIAEEIEELVDILCDIEEELSEYGHMDFHREGSSRYGRSSYSRGGSYDRDGSSSYDRRGVRGSGRGRTRVHGYTRRR